MYEYLVTANEMRAFDSLSINSVGIPGVVLMENAGRSTFNAVQKHFSSRLEGSKVSVIAGPGNNGGDGFVIARYLINQGAKVKTYLLAPKAKSKGDALINLNVLLAMHGDIEELQSLDSITQAGHKWRESELIIDAILGTGLQSDVRSPFREAISILNECTGFKVAVDIPSGLDSDTGQIKGCAVKSDLTVTYGFRKLGMALYPGRQLCGTIEVIDISIPRSIVEANSPQARLVNNPGLGAYFRKRQDAVAHKGSFGHILVVGGSPGKTGAAVMAARSASRIGAGLVTVAVPKTLNEVLENKLTEEMTAPIACDDDGNWNEHSCGQIIDLTRDKNCIVLGPGLSTSRFAQRIVETILVETSCPLVVDADGLNCLAKNIGIPVNNSDRLFLTPHPGEMSRLVGRPTVDVQGNRLETAKAFALEKKLWLVLKGAATIICSPQGRVFVNGSGSPWMASGGQGDALSGMLGGLLAQGLEPENAVALAVFMHGAIADAIIREQGLRPVLAMDLIERIPDYLAKSSASQTPYIQEELDVELDR